MEASAVFEILFEADRARISFSYLTKLVNQVKRMDTAEVVEFLLSSKQCNVTGRHLSLNIERQEGLLEILDSRLYPTLLDVWRNFVDQYFACVDDAPTYKTICNYVHLYGYSQKIIESVNYLRDETAR